MRNLQKLKIVDEVLPIVEGPIEDVAVTVKMKILLKLSILIIYR